MAEKCRRSGCGGEGRKLSQDVNLISIGPVREQWSWVAGEVTLSKDAHGMS